MEFFRYCLTNCFLEYFVHGLSKGGLQVKITKNTLAVFPRVSKKREPNNDDKHYHGQEKRRPSTYVEGKIKVYFYVSGLSS